MGVNALRVVTYKRRTGGQLVVVPLKSDSLKFICVGAAVGMALDLLESRASFVALCVYTIRLAAEASNVPRLRGLKQGGERELVQEFLAAIRASIPHILVTQEHGMGIKNGRTNKRDCPSLFDPKQAAVIELNDKLVTMLVNACDNARIRRSSVALAGFQTLLCRISITLAHELVHVFTLFLRRQRTQHTPPRLTYGDYGDNVVGEVGRFWEFNVFGGYIDMRRGPQMEAIALRGNRAGRVWRLRSQLIERLVARDFSWLDEPLTESDHPHYRQATELTDNYNWVERFVDVLPLESSGRNSPQELSDSQIRELVGLSYPQFPAHGIPGADLRAFSRDPTGRVRVS